MRAKGDLLLYGGGPHVGGDSTTGRQIFEQA